MVCYYCDRCKKQVENHQLTDRYVWRGHKADLCPECNGDLDNQIQTWFDRGREQET